MSHPDYELTYVHRPIPQTQDTDKLVQYLLEELHMLQDVLSGKYTVLRLIPQHHEPDKPRDGDIVLADGTSWDPGAGVGVYARISGAWVKL